MLRCLFRFSIKEMTVTAVNMDIYKARTNISTGSIIDLAKSYRSRVYTTMEKLRIVVDEAETLVGSDNWPYPTYGDLMFSVK